MRLDMPWEDVSFFGAVGLLVAFIIKFFENKWFKAAAYIGGFFLVFLQFESERFYEQNLMELAGRADAFCSESGHFWACVYNWEYGKYRKDKIKNQFIDRPILVEKPIYRYIKIHENNLLADNIDKLRVVVGADFEKARYTLGGFIGVGDIAKLGAQPISKSTLQNIEKYEGSIQFDYMLPTIRAYDPQCVNSAFVRVVVSGNKVKSLSWIGDIKKPCFDAVWQPSIIRLHPYQYNEELPETNSMLDRVFRYYDDAGIRELFVTSRSLQDSKQHVGIRISLISVDGPMVDNYRDYEKVKGIYQDVDSIAAQ